MMDWQDSTSCPKEIWGTFDKEQKRKTLAMKRLVGGNGYPNIPCRGCICPY